MEYELTDFLYWDTQMSEGHINRLMEIWSANMQEGTSPFSNCKHLQTHIDSIEVGDVPWQSFSCKYRGTVTEESPTWMKQEYEVHCRDPLEVVRNILANTEFDGLASSVGLTV